MGALIEELRREAAARAGEDRSEIKHLIELLIYGFRSVD
jgi:hypothetical protein